jgi:hypothetical protein
MHPHHANTPLHMAQACQPTTQWAFHMQLGQTAAEPTKLQMKEYTTTAERHRNIQCYRQQCACLTIPACQSEPLTLAEPSPFSEDAQLFVRPMLIINNSAAHQISSASCT